MLIVRKSKDKKHNMLIFLIKLVKHLKEGVLVLVKFIINVTKYIEKKLQTDNGRRITHWLLFSVILSLLPLFLAISQDRMSIECTFDQIKEKYATDFILAVFAVAVNLCGCTVHGRVRVDGLGVSIVSMLYLLSKYIHLHNPKTELLPGVMNDLLGVVLGLLVINAIFGIILQVVSDKKNEK